MKMFYFAVALECNLANEPQKVNFQCVLFQGDLNTGGIVAGVIVALLLLLLLGLAIWYANKKGYLPSECTLLPNV